MKMRNTDVYDNPTYKNNNYREWQVDGKYHRVNGPAKIWAGHLNRQEWWLDGRRHRVGAPAVIDGEHYQYWLNGKRHREDGPACVKGEYRNWFLDGKLLTEEEFNTLMRGY